MKNNETSVFTTSKQKRGFKDYLEISFPYLLIGPLVIWVLATVFIPLLSVVKESFYSTGFVGSTGEFIGFDNFKNALTNPNYWGAWGKSLFWVIGNMFIQTLLAFSVALLLNRSSKISKLARTWVIVPWIIPTIVVAIFWQWIFNGSYGILNHLLLSFHIIDQPLNLLGDPNLALPIIVIINSWHWFPFLAILILAGLAGIPKEVYEAASVDGANKWQEFFHITLPFLQNLTFVLGLVGTLWMFNIFDLIQVLTEGGPAGSTKTIPVFIYQEAFENYSLGSASAMSLITAVILVIFAIVYIKFASPKD